MKPFTTRWLPLVASLMAPAWLLLCSAEASAAEKKVIYYRLDRVLIADHSRTKNDPEGAIKDAKVQIRASNGDAKGGRLVVGILCWHEPSDNKGPHWTEWELLWRFDRDISQLRKGDRFTTHYEAKRTDNLGSTCQGGYWRPVARTGEQFACAALNELKLPHSNNIFACPNKDYNFEVYPAPEDFGRKVDYSHDTLFEILQRDEPWGQMYVAFGAPYHASPGAVYFYRAVYEGETPPGGSGTVTGGGGTSGGGTSGGGTLTPTPEGSVPGNTSGGCGCSTSSTATGGGNLPAEPCLDAKAQQCIDEWTAKVITLLNRYDKSKEAPGGPYRIGPYGQLLGHMVVNALPPDGWESVHHSNKYCFIWVASKDWHRDPIYRGELPPLHDYVRDCYRKLTGGGAAATTAGPTPVVPGEPAAVSRMTLQAGFRIVSAGELVVVPVWLIKAENVANMNFTLSYDPAVARPEGEIVKGNLLGDALFRANPNESGIIRIGFAQTRGLSGTGTVALIPFRAVGKPGDETNLHLEVTTLNNPDGTVLPIDRIDGCIRIAGPDGRVPGDCDGDGRLTLLDAACALEMSVRLRPEAKFMDVDDDGRVTSRDATIILQRATQQIRRRAAVSSLPQTNRLPQADRRKSAIMPGGAALMLAAAVLGAADPAGAAPASQRLTVNLDCPPAAPGREAAASISVRDAVALVGVQFALVYDPKVLKAKSVDKGKLLTSNSMLEFNTEQSDSVRVALVSLDDIQGEGPVAVARFEVLGQPGQKTALRLEEPEAWAGKQRLPLLISTAPAEFVVASAAPPPWQIAAIAAGVILVLLIARKVVRSKPRSA